jgi:hypothetical protein
MLFAHVDRMTLLVFKPAASEFPLFSIRSSEAKDSSSPRANLLPGEISSALNISDTQPCSPDAQVKNELALASRSSAFEILVMWLMHNMLLYRGFGHL